MFSSKQHFGARLIQKYFFLYYSARAFLAILKVCLNDVEIWFFFFKGHFLIIMGSKI